MILFEMLDALPLDALGAAIAGAVSAEGALVLDLDAGDVTTGSWFGCGGIAGAAWLLCARRGGTLPLRDGTLRDGTVVEAAGKPMLL